MILIPIPVRDKRFLSSPNARTVSGTHPASCSVVKVKFVLKQAVKVPNGEYRYSSTLSLTSALNRVWWLTPGLGQYTPGNRTRYPLCRRQGRPQGRSGLVRKISPPPGFDSRNVQPEAGRYIYWAIAVHQSIPGLFPGPLISIGYISCFPICPRGRGQWHLYLLVCESLYFWLRGVTCLVTMACRCDMRPCSLVGIYRRSTLQTEPALLRNDGKCTLEYMVWRIRRSQSSRSRHNTDVRRQWLLLLHN
jgi:hypothetical protein